MKLKRYYLHPGFLFYSNEPHRIETILGSCVSLCIWDVKRKSGGMNHHIFAKGEKSTRFGNVAIPYLVKTMIEDGSKIQDLRAYLIGGATNKAIKPEISNENILIAKKIARKLGLRIVKEDTGGYEGRKVIFYNYSGKIEIIRLDKSKGRKIWEIS